MQKKITYILIFFVTFFSIILSQPSKDDYKTVNSGYWDEPEIWQRFNGSGWVPAVNSPNALNANIITIEHEARIRDSLVVDQVKILDAFAPCSIILVDTSGTLIIQDGPGVDLISIIGELYVHGTIVNYGQIDLTGQERSIIKSSGRYQHMHDSVAGHIPAFEWEVGANCEILGYTDYTGDMDVAEQTFYNLTWDCQHQTGFLRFDTSFSGMLGDFKVVNTGAGSICLNYLRPHVVNGNFYQFGGVIDVSYQAPGFDCGGDLKVLGNTYFISGSIICSAFSSVDTLPGIFFSGLEEKKIIVEDEFTFGPRTRLELMKNSIRVLVKDINIDDADLNLRGKLNCNNFIITGNEGFRAYEGSTLNIGSPDGIYLLV